MNAPGGDPVVLITGATGGLGTPLCRRYLESGWQVLAHGRDPSRLAKLAHELPVSPFTADLGSVREVNRLALALSQAVGAVDLLINNAGLGYGPPGQARQVSADGVESRFAVNTLAPYVLTRLLHPLLACGAGRVINVGSTNQRVHTPHDWNLERRYTGEIAYQQSKAALLIVTQVLAEELRCDGIRVDVVHPGSRLPTRMVTESGVLPLTPLSLGVETIVGAAGSRVMHPAPLFFQPTQAAAPVAAMTDPEAERSLMPFLEPLVAELTAQTTE